MWIFLTIMNMLLPVTMILFGNYFRKKAPKKINYFFGYRTRMSMINEDTWIFAHKHFGRTWYVSGWILSLVTITSMLFLIGKDIDTIVKIELIIIYGQCVPLVISIIPTEMALRKNFDKNGKRKLNNDFRSWTEE